MAFTPILSDKSIAYVRNNTYYRNAPRESQWGSPVFFLPSDRAVGLNGEPGPKYEPGYTYDNSPDTHLGNCTWWCMGRLVETGCQTNVYWGIGSAVSWYSNYTGSKETNANNIQAGDIIVLAGGDYGHVMFVEQVSGSTIYISQSAYSDKSIWIDKACKVNNYQKSEIYIGSSINIYKNYGINAYYTVVGVLHTGGGTPPSPGHTPSVTVAPSSTTITLDETATYVDMAFTITVSGIPEGENAQSAISFSSNCYRHMYTSNWTYTTYTINGVTYQTGTRSLIVRYDRLHDYAYTDTAHMYYIKTFSNGSVSSDTPMYITIQAKSDDMTSIYTYLLNKRKALRRVRVKIK